MDLWIDILHGGDQLSVIEIDTLVMDDLPLYQVNQPVILMQCGYGDEKRGLGINMMSVQTILYKKVVRTNGVCYLVTWASRHGETQNNEVVAGSPFHAETRCWLDFED